MKKVLVLGGTGATGKHVINELRANEDVAKIKMITRREVELPEGPGLEKVEQVLVDFDNLDKSKADFNEVDVAFCCLGTTRRQAGKEGFIKVDYDYVVNSAKILKDAECKDFHLLSSIGMGPYTNYVVKRDQPTIRQKMTLDKKDRPNINQ